MADKLTISDLARVVAEEYLAGQRAILLIRQHNGYNVFPVKNTEEYDWEYQYYLLENEGNRILTEEEARKLSTEEGCQNKKAMIAFFEELDKLRQSATL